MAESKIIINEKNSSKELKLKLQKKLDEVKSKISKLKIDLCYNIDSQGKNISLGYDKYIKNLKNGSYTYINEKGKKIKNKEFLFFEHSKFINKLKEIENFNKNLIDIIITSLENYNNFLLDKLPYYKESSTLYMINQSEKLANNHIFNKLNKKQINQIINEIKNKNLINLIKSKYQLNILITPSNNIIEEKSLLESITQYDNNKIELNDLKDEDFRLLFNKESYYEKNELKQNELIFQKCEFKNIYISEIPFDLINLKIINSKISSSIFDKIQFNNLISLILDDCKLDSDIFENIFKIFLKKNNESCNNSLKILSAKNNLISRIIKKEEIKKLNNKFTSLEIFNLANNNINDVNNSILEFIPNIKIFDLSNNSLIQEYKCKNLIKNCKGFVILVRNIGIMKDEINKIYREYYLKNIVKNDCSIYSINFETLFYKRNYDSILSIDYSNFKKNKNILEINFSSCNINDNSMITILLKCIAINNNLSKLNLSFNLLTEKFLDLLIKENFDILLNKLIELDLSFNLIEFKENSKYSSGNSKNNHFIFFLNHFPNLEMLSLKGTPFEDKFNEYLKKEINIFYENDKKHNIITKIEGEFLEIKEILENNYLFINPNFYLRINYILPVKYSKRTKIMQNEFFKKHLIIDNII